MVDRGRPRVKAVAVRNARSTCTIDRLDSVAVSG
jgi:hypothetical protein